MPGAGCSQEDRQFNCTLETELVCCRHPSETVGWRCQGGFLNRIGFAGEDCSVQTSEIVGYLSVPGEISRASRPVTWKPFWSPFWR